MPSCRQFGPVRIWKAGRSAPQPRSPTRILTMLQMPSFDRATARLALASVIVVSIATLLAIGILHAEEVDKIVASVDGDPITTHEVRAYAESAGQTIPPGDPTSDPTFKQGLKGLIAQKLLNQEVKKYD